MPDSAVSPLNDQSAIRAVLDEYCLRLEVDEFDKWMDLFTEDTVYEVYRLILRGRQEVADPAQSALAEHEHPEKAGFQKEREEPLHRQRLTDDATGKPREPGPVCPELKLHRHAGDHAHGEVEAKHSNPEPRGIVPTVTERMLVADRHAVRLPRGSHTRSRCTRGGDPLRYHDSFSIKVIG